MLIALELDVFRYSRERATLAILDHQPNLAVSPEAIVAALQLTEPDFQDAALPPAGTTAKTGN